jgi:hypothetical protein
MSDIDERVKIAFTGTIRANDSALSTDQIRAIAIICQNIDFARAVGREIFRLGILNPPKEPTSVETEKTEPSSSGKDS